MNVLPAPVPKQTIVFARSACSRSSTWYFRKGKAVGEVTSSINGRKANVRRERMRLHNTCVFTCLKASYKNSVHYSAFQKSVAFLRFRRKNDQCVGIVYAHQTTAALKSRRDGKGQLMTVFVLQYRSLIFGSWIQTHIGGQLKKGISLWREII